MNSDTIMTRDAYFLANHRFLSELYEEYLQNSSSLDPAWRVFFQGVTLAQEELTEKELDGQVQGLIEAYRRYGYRKKSYNPLSPGAQQLKELELQTYALSEEDLTKSVPSFGFLSPEKVFLKELIAELERRFCSSVGIELGDFSQEKSRWLDENWKPKALTKDQAVCLLDQLLRAELFETFLHGKYPGQMRFSLEGVETLIPLLICLIEESAESGIEEIILGMSHRGRLNVISSILDLSCDNVLREFEDLVTQGGSGDVKYHKGVSSLFKTKKGKIVRITLSPNASHLESVGSIVEGKVRALQDVGKKAIAFLVHGDAAFAGQGVVYETLQLESLPGYEVGGTVHLVLDNYIGYTTVPEESRSSLYCTDIAKTFGGLVVHLQAEQPESIFAVGEMVIKARNTYGRDVFIDLGCYRKHGHNEGDEPSFTQPLHYQNIHKRPSIRKLLEEKLIQEGVLTKEEVSAKELKFQKELSQALTRIPQKEPELKKELLKENKTPMLTKDVLGSLLSKTIAIPDAFSLHPKLKKVLEERKNIDAISWSTAEQLAFASLLLEGVPVRLSGQDVCRGTFAQRHAVLVDQKSGEKFIPLAHLSSSQASFSIFNSPLSEFAVLGFELGYSSMQKKGLTVWEAQFGDFANGAQVIIDQYLVCSEQKWEQNSGLTLFLPHGYEGKGPEHSSARIERFLQLSAEDNLFVVNCTTPAQLYHVLRRQAYLTHVRPLILFTPKLLLRHPGCISSLDEFSSGSFFSCLQDIKENVQAERILLCSGKVFYDLLEQRERVNDIQVAILRIEQLYPFPQQELQKLLAPYTKLQEIFWVQEEPKNMGAWEYVQLMWKDCFPNYPRLHYIGRTKRASPAVGSYKSHSKERESFLQKAYQR